MRPHALRYATLFLALSSIAPVASAQRCLSTFFHGGNGGAVGGAQNNAGTQISQFRVLPGNEAHGWYLDFGYKVLPNLELDVRYDWLDRITEGPAQVARNRELSRWTLGAQYFFNKKSRFTLNYEFRDIEAPTAPAGAKTIVSGVDDLLSAQLLIIF